MSRRNPAPVAVLGAGSWGTALAVQFARGGRSVRLWGRDGAQLAALARARCNERYLPGVTFPQSLEIRADLGTPSPAPATCSSSCPVTRCAPC